MRAETRNQSLAAARLGKSRRIRNRHRARVNAPDTGIDLAPPRWRSAAAASSE
jgi:hypothetical protein